LANDSFAENAVAWLLEPRCLRPENYEAAKAKAHLFKAVLSYDLDFVEKIHNGRWYPLGGSSIDFHKWKIYPKSKSVCMFYSGKDSTTGHSLRKEIAEKFGHIIDIYGKGAGRPVRSKFEVLKDYRYCVVIESCWISGYFSEKILDAFSVGCMVLYWGWYKYFKDTGAIHPFLTPSDLELLLKHVVYDPHNNDYDAYIQTNAKKTIETLKHFSICEDNIAKANPDIFPRNIFT
jgi:hypothetical protein